MIWATHEMPIAAYGVRRLFEDLLSVPSGIMFVVTPIIVLSAFGLGIAALAWLHRRQEAEDIDDWASR